MEEKNLSPLKATEEAMAMETKWCYYCHLHWYMEPFHSMRLCRPWIVALTLTPALCALILKNNHGKAKKKTPVTIFLDKFNNIFTKGAGKYEKTLNKTVTKKMITLPLLLAFCAVLMISNSLPSDTTGSTIGAVQSDAKENCLKESEDIDGVQSVSSLAGYEILTEGPRSNSAYLLINLKSWDERKWNTAAGYSSGQAIKAIQEVADKTLPRGFGIDWAGISKDEVSRGMKRISFPGMGWVFSELFVFEAYGMEIISMPQVAMVYLSVFRKNAVLIVEFAVQKRAEEGIPVAQAAIQGAAIRFRPILMTFICIYAGIIPLEIATGPMSVREPY
ncbi:hypothetical protein FQR65_LT16156 [Abscondita terminalis]|nr:hypothetical protein FQR65_LT16156 [Abscondita terminalis]